MSGWTAARNAIQSRTRPGSKVLVVEGEDDKLFIEAMLDKVAPGTWPGDWTIGAANGKNKVLSILRDQPGWWGLLDRDEWTSQEISNQQALFPGRLFFLPRYCMESYFIFPAEVWQSLPARQNDVADGLTALETAIHTGLPGWLRHGCLWHAVNPLQEGLRALGFKDALLDHANAQNDAVIRQTLQDWHQFLDPEKVEAQFQANLTTAFSSSIPEQFTTWVHGKKFFEQHVVPALNELLGQDSSDKWLTELRKDLPVPSDLDFLWSAMGLPRRTRSRGTGTGAYATK
jgi:hypothetical protein